MPKDEEKINIFKSLQKKPTIPSEKEIKEKVAHLINKEVTITNLVDPSLLGGFILRVGDLQYNASVAAQLQQLEREFTNI